MKASELMMGDFVISTQNKKVYQIDPIIAYGIADATLNKDQDINNHFEPIPLTEKILKLNGFVYDDYTGGRHDLCYCMIPNEQMTITITKFGSKDKRGHYECHKVIIDRNGDIYVHELQHALRICGLNELADNFKIE